MGSPPIPDRSPAPPSPKAKPSAVSFSPPKRKSGGSLKGKERALEENSYPGEITYRHLLGAGSGGPSNPLRCVAHIDIDAAYAAMEMARLGIDPSVPLAVQQWNGLIAVNYPARTFGITRHESPAEALKKCPELMLVHCATYRQGDLEPGYWGDNPKPETHKISLDHYRRESLKIIKVFAEFCPVVEKASIDESFLDVTLPVRAELLARYPALAQLPPDATLDTPLPSPYSLGARLDFSAVGNLVPNEGQVKDAKAKDDAEEAQPLSREDREDESTRVLREELDVSWSDVALYLGAEIVGKCRSTVHERLGYTCSAGIAPNKMLAKLCSAWKKPNAQTILRFTAKIRNLGGKLGASIAEAYEAETVQDLLSVSVQELQRKMGEESGMWVWEIVRGLDFSEVEAKTQVKSMLSSKNFKPAISKFSEVSHWMAILATELHLRLLEAREISPGLWPKTITFSHRSENYVVKSHQLAFQYTSRFDVAYVSKFADRLFRTAIGAGEKTTKVGPDSRVGPYSNLQLSLSGLERLEEGQKGIERFFVGAEMTAGPSTAKEKIKPTPLPDPKKRARTESDDGVEPKPVVPSPKKKKAKMPIAPASVTLSSDDGAPPLPTFKCPRCSRVLTIPPGALAELPPGRDAAALDALLGKEKAEHGDYHFTRDLLEGERKAQRDGVGGKSAGGGGKKAGGAAKASGSGTGKGKTAEKPKVKGQQSLKGFFGKG
ncbi:hypothetical protein RQP46_003992 [Phenoliferia psychrophenolica]